jgi:hypothetical protein
MASDVLSTPSRAASRGAATPKDRLLAWVDDQCGVDLTAKWVLMKLAVFADAERTAWAAVSYLAASAMCSARKVQYALRDLEKAGLIRPTGHRHHLADSKFKRTVPLYQVAPEWDGRLGTPAEMGARSAPISADGCTADTEMGAAACSANEKREPKEFANAHSACEREALAAGFEKLEAATPQKVLGLTDPQAAFTAYCALAAEGLDVSELVGCAERMALDPAFRSRKFPAPLEVWLTKCQFRGWWTQSVLGTCVERAPAPTDATQGFTGEWVGVPSAIRADIVALPQCGEAWARSWIDPCAWDEAASAIVPRSLLARGRIREMLAPHLRAWQITISEPRGRTQ